MKTLTKIAAYTSDGVVSVVSKDKLPKGVKRITLAEAKNILGKQEYKICEESARLVARLGK